MDETKELTEDDSRADLQSVESLTSTTSKRNVNKLCFIINHEGKFKVIWDWFVLMLVIITAIQIPYYAAFYDSQKIIMEIKHPKEIETVHMITIIVDLMFILDIFINFRTTFIRSTSDKLENNPKKLAIHYLKTWFIIDLLAAIPFDWIMYSFEDGRTSNLVGLLKSARLLRLFRVARRLDRYSEYGLAVLFLLMCLFTLFAHWLACIWNYISITEKGNPNSWVRRMDEELTSVHMVCLSRNSTSEINTTAANKIRMTGSQRYIASLYFVVSSLTSVGFGNIAATTEIEQVFSVCVMLIGALMYACIFGNMVAIVQRLYSKTSTYHYNRKIIREFMKYHKLPEELQHTIDHHVKRNWATSQGFDSKKVFQHFPESLHADITYELYHKVFYSIKPFRNATVSCMRALSMKFKTIILQENQLLLRQGEELKRLYIVLKGDGSLEVLRNGELVTILTGNRTFGVDAKNLGRRTKSNANVRVESLANVHYIDKKDLIEIMEIYPKFAQYFKAHCNHIYDLNSLEEEGYYNPSPKQNKAHISAIARQALFIPMFSSLYRKESKRHNSPIDQKDDQEMTSVDNRVKSNHLINGDTKWSSENSPVPASKTCKDLNEYNPKPIIKNKLSVTKTYSDTSSVSSVRFYDLSPIEQCEKSENQVFEMRLNRLEQINEKLDAKLSIIISILENLNLANNSTPLRNTEIPISIIESSEEETTPFL